MKIEQTGETPHCEDLELRRIYERNIERGNIQRVNSGKGERMKIEQTGEVPHCEDLELRRIYERNIEENLIKNIISSAEVGKTYKLSISCKREMSEIDENFYKISYTASLKEISENGPEKEDPEEESSTIKKLKKIDTKIKKMSAELERQLRK